MADFHDNYGFFDKLLHRVAFNSVSLQLSLAQGESDEHRAALDALKIEKPAFISSLPRSGTTILLELLSESGVYCYHSYRDMPFLFTPILWGRFAARFAKNDELRERAHGDGIKINQQSPEAFEEMFYKAFWPEYFKGDKLPLWSEQPNPLFDRFFCDHIKKLRLRDGKARYLSKNNLNITRLPYLKRLFPDGRFVVPFRDPLQHAMSLLKQHENFTALHRRNPFAKRYMEAIGHHDFGDNLKPVDFDGGQSQSRYDPMQLDFWLEYWISAYCHLLGQAEFVNFVGFEALCEAPESQLERLAGILDIDSHLLVGQAGRIRPAKPHSVDVSCVDKDNLEASYSLYRALSGLI